MTTETARRRPALLNRIVRTIKDRQLFSPGHHLPVYPSDAIYEREADAVAVLAWNYAAPIIAKHRRFADAGGRFLIPLPQLQVI